MLEDKEGEETRTIDVENADSICKLIKQENTMNEGDKNEFEETEVAKHTPDRIGGGIEDEVSVNLFEETLEQIDGVNDEDNNVNVGYKNEAVDEEVEEPEDVNILVKNEVTKEGFVSKDEDGDWEGIEMSELYNDYKSAAAYVRNQEKDSKFSNTCSELKMHLYGLQKIVMEGTCREAQPMAIKMSARAKWNAWQKLESINPEDTMKQYIALVSGLNLASAVPKEDRVDL